MPDALHRHFRNRPGGGPTSSSDRSVMATAAIMGQTENQPGLVTAGDKAGDLPGLYRHCIQHALDTGGANHTACAHG